MENTLTIPKRIVALLLVSLIGLAIFLHSASVKGASNWWWTQRTYGPAGAYYSSTGATSNHAYVKAGVAGTNSSYRRVA